MRTRTWTVAVAAALSLCTAVPAALAAPGDLDPSYGSGGKATIDLGTHEGAFALRIQPDGKLVLGGYTQGNGGHLSAAFRLLTNGSRDLSFSGDGEGAIHFGGGAVGEAPPPHTDRNI